MTTKAHKPTTKTHAKPRSLKVERLFDASPETLWSYWTDPEKYAQWFNPAPGMELVIHEYDVRVGGRVRFDMPQPDGNRNPQEGVFHVLKPYREIVTGAPDRSFVITVRLTPVGKRTRMTVSVAGIPPEYHEGATKGWNAGFDKLARLLGAAAGPRAARHPVTLTLPSDREILVSRLFDAPRERVFQAHVDPRAMEAWWGPGEYATTVDRWDPRPGGTWRIVQRTPDGAQHAFHGIFQDVVPPERLIWTFEYEGLPGHVVNQTLTFEEAHGGKTRLTVRALYRSREDRDGMLASGMEWGMRESYERLDERLARED